MGARCLEQCKGELDYSFNYMNKCSIIIIITIKIIIRYCRLQFKAAIKLPWFWKEPFNKQPQHSFSVAPWCWHMKLLWHQQFFWEIIEYVDICEFPRNTHRHSTLVSFPLHLNENTWCFHKTFMWKVMNNIKMYFCAEWIN